MEFCIHFVIFPKLINAFRENFIRTKFILHKIFFRMSILSSKKTSRMFFNLCWKNCTKPFMRGHDHFEGKVCPITKININFFVRNEVLNIFYKTIFSKKKNNIFQNNSEKKFLDAMTIFQRMGCLMTKTNITFFMENGAPDTVLKFFPRKKNHIGWMKAKKKKQFGVHFPPHQWFYWTECLKKNNNNRVHPCVDLHQPCEFHEN